MMLDNEDQRTFEDLSDTFGKIRDVSGSHRRKIGDAIDIATRDVLNGDSTSAGIDRTRDYIKQRADQWASDMHEASEAVKDIRQS